MKIDLDELHCQRAVKRAVKAMGEEVAHLKGTGYRPDPDRQKEVIQRLREEIASRMPRPGRQ